MNSISVVPVIFCGDAAVAFVAQGCPSASLLLSQEEQNACNQNQFKREQAVVWAIDRRRSVVRINDRVNPRTQAREHDVTDLSWGSARALGTEGVGSVAIYTLR